jgi:hypothetical protein
MGTNPKADLIIFWEETITEWWQCKSSSTRERTNPRLHGKLVDCTANRDDAAMPWLTVPNNKKDRRKLRC